MLVSNYCPMNPNDPNNPNNPPSLPGQADPNQPTTVNDPPISPIPGLDNTLSNTSPAPNPSPWSPDMANSQAAGGPFPPPPITQPVPTPPAPNTSSNPWDMSAPPTTNQPVIPPFPSNEPSMPPAPSNPPMPTFVSPTGQSPTEASSNSTSALPPFLDPNTSAAPPADPSNILGPNSMGPLPSSEPAPTDLSQLTGNTEQPPPPDIYVPAVSNPENLVVPTNSSAESMKPEGGRSGHGLLPKLLIGIGIIVVLAVAGASAYFILGIGKPTEPTTSVPAQTDQSALTNPPTPAAVPTAQPTTDPAATDSASLGDLNPQPTDSGSSALDLLKSRTKSSASPAPIIAP